MKHSFLIWTRNTFLMQKTCCLLYFGNRTVKQNNNIPGLTGLGTTGCLLSSWCFEPGSAASVTSSSLEQKRQNTRGSILLVQSWCTVNAVCFLCCVLVNWGGETDFREVVGVCTSWKPHLKICPELLHGLLGTWCCFPWWVMWIGNWLEDLSFIMGLGDSCKQSTADVTRTKHWWDVECSPSRLCCICWRSCFVCLLNTHISFWLQLLWWHMSFWEKSCLSPDWQHLCKCEISQFLSEELLTAHPSWGSDRVWCKFFPPNIDNQLGQDLATKSWCSSHHELLQEPKVDKFPLAQAEFVVQPVLQKELCPRALLAHSMFSDSFKNT